GDRLVDREEARRSEEPHLVLLDRTALGEIGVVVGADLVDGLDAARCEPRRQVVALELAALVPFEERPVEPIAALFRNEVDLHAAGGRIDCATASLIDHLLI